MGELSWSGGGVDGARIRLLTFVAFFCFDLLPSLSFRLACSFAAIASLV